MNRNIYTFIYFNGWMDVWTEPETGLQLLINVYHCSAERALSRSLTAQINLQ